MNNVIKVINENGNEIEVEVLDIFSLVGHDDKEYIVYSRGKEVNDHVEVFVSILRQENNEFYLDTIEDEKEWQEVQKAIDEMGEMNA